MGPQQQDFTVEAHGTVTPPEHEVHEDEATEDEDE